jgi:cell division protein FtsL
MNATVRAIAQNNEFIRNTLISLNLPELKILVLIFLLLLSSFGMIYIKDLNRRLFITYNKLQVQGEQLRAANNKLLLGYSACTAQSRIQKVAQDRLHMQIPPPAEVVVIKM